MLGVRKTAGRSGLSVVADVCAPATTEDLYGVVVPSAASLR